MPEKINRSVLTERMKDELKTLQKCNPIYEMHPQMYDLASRIADNLPESWVSGQEFIDVAIKTLLGMRRELISSLDKTSNLLKPDEYMFAYKHVKDLATLVFHNDDKMISEAHYHWSRRYLPQLN